MALNFSEDQFSHAAPPTDADDRMAVTRMLRGASDKENVRLRGWGRFNNPEAGTHWAHVEFANPAGEKGATQRVLMKHLEDTSVKPLGDQWKEHG